MKIIEKGEMPPIPKTDGVHLKYVINNDTENHPVFHAEYNSLDPSRVFGSDAYIIRANKREAKGQFKMVQQIKQTLRFKPTVVDTKDIMVNFRKKR